jgi:hypothetical protein
MSTWMRVSYPLCVTALLAAMIYVSSSVEPAVARAAGDGRRETITRFFKTHADAVEFQQQGDSLLLANRQLGLEFKRALGGFRIARLYSVRDGQDFLAEDRGDKELNLLQIVPGVDPSFRVRVAQTPKNAGVISCSGAKRTSFHCSGGADQRTLQLACNGIDLPNEPEAVDIEMTVTLKASSPFAYWRFKITNRSIPYGIDEVYFPVLSLAPIGSAQENVFIYPLVRGCLVEDPFHQPPGYGDGVHRSGRYPAAFGMQFQALYNKRTGVGLYLGTQDPTPNLKNTESPNAPDHITWKPGHFPPNVSFGRENYTLAYDCVTGPFSGDWWDACQIYRAWAVQQNWCRKGPLATRRDIPQWYKESPLFLVAFSHSNNDSIPATVRHYIEYLRWAGVRLPCDWYGWKHYRTELTAYDAPHSYWRANYRGQGPCENVHDGNYPKLPALPGFAAACRELRQSGGMVCPYVCLQIYDQGPVENAPYAAEARSCVVRDPLGTMQNYDREPSWAMCASAPWWRDRLRQSCLGLLRDEHVGGFYLDTMHGTTEPCYWTPHGHSSCGGSAGPLGMHGLAGGLRDAVQAADAAAITTGEDPAENMIDVIDGKLYQFTLRPNFRAPLFAAVYQEYIRRYGMTVNVDSEDRFCMEAGSLFVEGAQMGRLALAPMESALSFEKPEHRAMVGFLGRLVAYYRQPVAKKFLCYGQLMRPLSFREPSPMPTLSFDAEGNKIELPALLSGVFRCNEDGQLAVFVVNLSAHSIAFAADMILSRHGFSGAAAKVATISPEGEQSAYSDAREGRLRLQATLAARSPTMFLLSPADR